MQCPFCHAPATESELQCAACGFTLERVERFFGVMPRLQPGVSDLAALLKPRSRRKIDAATRRLHDRFPQVTFSVVTASLPPEYPLSAYAFWIFNRGGVCPELERGGKSRDILLLIDAASSRTALIVGYGLEPFLSSTHLHEILNAGSAVFAKQGWAEGVLAIIDRATAMLAEVYSQLPRIYGLDLATVRQAEDPAVAKAQPAGVY